MKQLIDAAAVRHGLDPVLVAAIIQQESAGNTWAFRFEPGFRWFSDYVNPACSRTTERNAQATSWGLMQIMGAVARERGCTAPFLSALCDPTVGLEYGCRHLAWLKGRGYTLHEVISAYNQGSPRRLPSGDFANMEYVNGVLAHMKELA